ncbi:MAG: hypothetical protein QOJ35_3165 [Solirubrobacteraceae bacterium]|jgi:hypothetical protein|nr:hypothetical protein [Solirubrobacteraceae bacterium]
MHEGNDPAAGSRRRALIGRAPRTRSVLLATGVLVVGIAPFGIAATGDSLREGRRNGTTVNETEIVGNVKSSLALKGGYVTRQSNLSDSGGGAVYGCRSQAGGSRATPTPQNPCIRANNLSRGLAFEFNTTIGDVAGAITAGSGGDAKRPFTTNATGVATGLNADRVDSLDAAQIVAVARVKTGLDADTVDGIDAADLRPRFAQVTSGGALGETRGLIATNPVTHTATSGIYAVKFAGDLSKCAVSATLTGGALGEIVAVPTVVAGDTTITVTTADSTGSAEDRAFHVSANC